MKSIAGYISVECTPCTLPYLFIYVLFFLALGVIVKAACFCLCANFVYTIILCVSVVFVLTVVFNLELQLE